MHPPALTCGPTILSRIMPDGPLLAFLDSPSHLVGSRLELWGQPPHFQPDALSIQLFAAPLCHSPPAQDVRLCALSLTVTGEVTASSGGCWGQLAGACSGTLWAAIHQCLLHLHRPPLPVSSLLTCLSKLAQVPGALQRGFIIMKSWKPPKCSSRGCCRAQRQASHGKENHLPVQEGSRPTWVYSHGA